MNRRVFGLIGGAAALIALASWAWLERRPSGVPGARLRIAAASDLRFALDEVVAAYGKERSASVPEVTYGSSGTLYAQIVNGAAFDIFMSADIEYPRKLAADNRIDPGSEFTYGTGRIVVWVPAASPLDVERAGLKVVADDRVAHVAIANPLHAPYGRAAEAALKGAGVYEAAAPKLVLGENIAQTLQFAQSGAADVAVAALSLALAPTMKDAGRYWIVPQDLYPELQQGGAILRAADVGRARDFRAYLLGETSRRTLARYGFSPPDQQHAPEAPVSEGR